jgi:hypothetical protein
MAKYLASQWSASFDQQRPDGQENEEHKEALNDGSGSTGNAEEAKCASDQRQDEENHRIVNHVDL